MHVLLTCACALAMQPVDTTFNVFIESIDDLPPHSVMPPSSINSILPHQQQLVSQLSKRTLGSNSGEQAATDGSSSNVQQGATAKEPHRDAAAAGGDGGGEVHVNGGALEAALWEASRGEGSVMGDTGPEREGQSGRGRGRSKRLQV